MAAKNLIPITIKSLSGEILSLQIPFDLSIKAFYYYVHSQLDPSIRPTLVQQLTLLRSSYIKDQDQETHQEKEKEKEKEKDEDKDKSLDPTDSKYLLPFVNELFFLLIDPNEYQVDFDLDNKYVVQNTSPLNNSYTCHNMRIYCNGEIIHQEYILYDALHSEWYEINKIPHYIPSLNIDQSIGECNRKSYVYIDADPMFENVGSIWSIAQNVSYQKLNISSNSSLLIAYFADSAWSSFH